jgi:hypothetical protein
MVLALLPEPGVHERLRELGRAAQRFDALHGEQAVVLVAVPLALVADPAAGLDP